MNQTCKVYWIDRQVVKSSTERERTEKKQTVTKKVFARRDVEQDIQCFVSGHESVSRATPGQVLLGKRTLPVMDRQEFRAGGSSPTGRRDKLLHVDLYRLLQTLRYVYRNSVKKASQTLRQ